MWMQEVSTVPFVFFGSTYNIKKTKPIEQYPTVVEIDIMCDDSIDEIASRDDIYGAEDQSYKLFEANINNLLEYKLNTCILQTMKVPVL